MVGDLARAAFLSSPDASGGGDGDGDRDDVVRKLGMGDDGMAAAAFAWPSYDEWPSARPANRMRRDSFPSSDPIRITPLATSRPSSLLHSCV